MWPRSTTSKRDRLSVVVVVCVRNGECQTRLLLAPLSVVACPVLRPGPWRCDPASSLRRRSDLTPHEYCCWCSVSLKTAHRPFRGDRVGCMSILFLASSPQWPPLMACRHRTFFWPLSVRSVSALLLNWFRVGGITRSMMFFVFFHISSVLFLPLRTMGKDEL